MKSPSSPQPSPADVAAWMLEELQRKRTLYQETAVYEIEKRFGKAFVYDNENGNPAINRKVLAAFRRISEDVVVWERGDRCWRLRGKHDAPGRQQE